MRKIYLSNTPRQEALERFLAETTAKELTEKVPVRAGLGRITAAPVFARLSMPGYHAAAMDGIAVHAERTYGASDQAPLELEAQQDYVNVNTGGVLPQGFNSVIKVEDIQELPGIKVEIIAPATPWQHIRAVGEDVVAGELIVTAGHKLKPADLGALLAGGVTELEVIARPRVAIIPSGSEVIGPDEARKPGKVPDFNSTVIAAYLEEWGAQPIVCPIVPDDPDKIEDAILAALDSADLVIINAGSSAGDKDYTFSVIDKLGEVFLHGIAARPGKPTILGKVRDKAVIGLPGYPVSAYLSLEWFALPLICRWLRQPVPEREKIEVSLGRRVVSEMGTEEFVRMNAGYVGGKYIANPLTRGAGVTMSLVRADGLLVIPANILGYEQNETVEMELYKPRQELRYNLLVAGSHDMIIDLLATAMKKDDPRINLSSSHLGSMGGINALGRGQAHMAGVHLFDPLTKEYNIPYVKKLLPGKNVHLFNLAYRMQGWIVPPGNPGNIKTVSDLAEYEIEFINRQKGAGTRLLFDHILEEAGIKPQQINGYSREEYTHLNVAAAVAAGTAGAALGILPAAKAFGLDFVPLAEERYDLLFSDDFMNSPEAELVLKTIADPLFGEQVESLGGYSLRDAGKKEL